MGDGVRLSGAVTWVAKLKRGGVLQTKPYFAHAGQDGASHNVADGDMAFGALWQTDGVEREGVLIERNALSVGMSLFCGQVAYEGIGTRGGSMLPMLAHFEPQFAIGIGFYRRGAQMNVQAETTALWQRVDGKSKRLTALPTIGRQAAILIDSIATVA